MMARRVADTSVTCNETAVIDMRALFERAMSVCLAADAAAQPTASLLDLEASERPSSSVCGAARAPRRARRRRGLVVFGPTARLQARITAALAFSSRPQRPLSGGSLALS